MNLLSASYKIFDMLFFQLRGVKKKVFDTQIKVISLSHTAIRLVPQEAACLDESCSRNCITVFCCVSNFFGYPARGFDSCQDGETVICKNLAGRLAMRPVDIGEISYSISREGWKRVVRGLFVTKTTQREILISVCFQMRFDKWNVFSIYLSLYCLLTLLTFLTQRLR